MQIAQPSVAACKIEEIGYERLRIYFLSRRDRTLPGKPFLPDTTFNQILRLLECDTKLRDTCFMGVGRFELVFRNRLSEVLSARFGSHPYFRNDAFDGSKQHNEALKKCRRSSPNRGIGVSNTTAQPKQNLPYPRSGCSRSS